MLTSRSSGVTIDKVDVRVPFYFMLFLKRRSAFGALAGLTLTWTVSAVAETVTWSGQDTSRKPFTDLPDNWVGGVVPSPGGSDDYVFTSVADGALTNPAALPVSEGYNNDLVFSSLTFTAEAPSFTLAGYQNMVYGLWYVQQVAGTHFLTQNSANPQTINAPVVVRGVQEVMVLEVNGTGAGALQIDRLAMQPNRGFTSTVRFARSATVCLYQMEAVDGEGERVVEIAPGADVLFATTGGNFTRATDSPEGTSDLNILRINPGVGAGPEAVIRVSETGQTSANVEAGSAVFGGEAAMTFNGAKNTVESDADTTWRFSNTGATTFTGAIRFGASNAGTSRTVTIMADSGAATTTFSGAITGTGGSGVTSVLKNGPGTVVFSGSNTYDGTTTVSNGSLLVSNASGSGLGKGRAVVEGKGVLGGDGSFTGAATINSGGTLSPGAGVGCLACGPLTFQAGSTFDYQVDSGGAGADLQIVKGDLALNGAITLANTAARPVAFPLGTTFSMFNYTGKWNGGLLTYNSVALADGAVFGDGRNYWQIDYDATGGGLNFKGKHLPASRFVNISSVPKPPAP